jgi:hypothetical protein
MATYRQWLQNIYNQGGATVKYGNTTVSIPRYVAQNLLNTVGDDGKTWSKELNKAINPEVGVWSAYKSGGQLIPTSANKRSTNTNTSGYLASGGSSSGSSATDPRLIAMWDSILDALGGQEKAAETSVKNAYKTSLNSLTGERDRAYSNLDREQSKLDSQKSKGLATLGSDIRNLLQSAGTQLGMYGAGNSSATDMAAYGASDLANKSSGDIQDQYNEQTGDISLARTNYGKEYDDKVKELEQDEKNKLIDVGDTFKNKKNAIREKKIAASNDTSGVQRDIDAIVNSYRNISSPKVKLNLPEYKGSGVVAQDVSGSIAAPALSQGQASQYFNVPSKRKKTDLF